MAAFCPHDDPALQGFQLGFLAISLHCITRLPWKGFRIAKSLSIFMLSLIEKEKWKPYLTLIHILYWGAILVHSLAIILWNTISVPYYILGHWVRVVCYKAVAEELKPKSSRSNALMWAQASYPSCSVTILCVYAEYLAALSGLTWIGIKGNFGGLYFRANIGTA